MFGIQNFEAFVLAGIALNLVPGPDTFYILGRSIAQGRSIGLASSLGVSTGGLVHTLFAAVGLSALVTASATAFMVVKIIGAIYLVYLGARMLLTKADKVTVVETFDNASFFAAFKQGLITNVLNPKVAMFFLAFLPQFISADSPSHFMSFMVLGMTFVATCLLWGGFVAWSSAAISGSLRRNPKYLSYINKATGSLMVLLGVRLATSE